MMNAMMSSPSSPDSPDSHDTHLPGWQGMTIKEILEKVDLFNISAMVDDEKDGKRAEVKEDCFGVRGRIEEP